MMKRAIAIALIFLGGFMVRPAAAEEAPANLDALLQQIRKGSAQDQKENAEREKRFLADKQQQANLLAKAKSELAAEERRSDELERTFSSGEQRLGVLEAQLRDRMGNLGELFGVVRQVAGDTAGVVDGSLISAQYPGRGDALAAIAQSKKLPKISELEELWYAIQQEMTEAGKVVRFPAIVVGVDGDKTEREVVRVGPFTAMSGSKYLNYVVETHRLEELARQPASRHTNSVKKFTSATSGIVGVSIDPARGAILALLIQKATLKERIEQGGLIGNLIIVGGIIGLLLALWTGIRLMMISRAMKKELSRSKPESGNPLGRVLQVYFENRGVDVETLELKLDEAIIKEVPGIEKNISGLRVLAVLAPLMGLLGTVTGMIQVFQAIVLFGTGDPRVMAGGISAALVTTVLGLTVAIPLTLIYSMLNARSQELIQILEEQSAGIIAKHAEAAHRDG